MAAEPVAKKMKKMKQNTAEEAEEAEQSSSSSEKVKLDDLVLFSCAAHSSLLDQLVLKCASRRFAKIIQQQNAEQSISVSITDMMDNHGSYYGHSRVSIKRYGSKCMKSRVIAKEELTTFEREDLANLLAHVFSHFKLFKSLQLKSFELSTLTDILINAFNAEESFIPVQLKRLAIIVDFEYDPDWRMIERFSHLVRELDVKWRHTKTNEEKRLFWSAVARCENLRRLKTMTRCIEDFFFFNNLSHVFADGAKTVHVKLDALVSVVDMCFFISPMVQENAVVSPEVYAKNKKVHVQIQSHLATAGEDYLLRLMKSFVKLLPMDLSNVDIEQSPNHEEALLINIFRFLSFGATIHIGHWAQASENDDEEDVTMDILRVMILWLLISDKFSRTVDLLFVFLDIASLLRSFSDAIDKLQSLEYYDSLLVVYDHEKRKVTLTFKDAKIVMGFAHA